jgi:WD40 repeat protein
MIGAEEQPALGTNPFVGPRPFEQGEVLFGRDREVRSLVDFLDSERIVLLHSPSGAGKTSLIQAGLLPLLVESFDVWGSTRVNENPPASVGSRPINRYLLSALRGFEQEVPERLRLSAERLAASTLSEYLNIRPRRRGAPRNVLLVFDQFEEILTVDPLAVDAKALFFQDLGETLRDPHVWALLALREDYLAPLDPYARSVPTHLRNRFRIDLLDREAARQAMQGPALQGGRGFPAVGMLIDDLAITKQQQPDGSFVDVAGPNVEPLHLQVVCRRLWDALPAPTTAIGEAEVRSFGNVTDALAAYYREQVERIGAGDEGRERAIRRWFAEELISPAGTRGQVLRGSGASGRLANELIEELRDAQLVRAERRAGATWYELAHDRLIEPVRRDNAAWFDEHVPSELQRAALWDGQGRPSGLLLGREELARVETWAVEHPALLDEGDRAFLAASREAQAAAEREMRYAKRVRRLAIGASALAVLALLGAAVAGWQTWVSLGTQRQLREALARSYWVEGRKAGDDGDPLRALHWMALALKTAPRAPFGTGAVIDLAQKLPLTSLEDDLVKEPVRGAAFTRDGRVLSWSRGKAQLWDPVTRRPLTVAVHQGLVNGAMLTSDGRRGLSWTGEAAWLWDAKTGRQIGKDMELGAGTEEDDAYYDEFHGSFSQHGDRVLTWNRRDGSFRLWDGQSAALLRANEPWTAAGSEPGLNSKVGYVAAAAAGDWVLTRQGDGTAQIWRQTQGNGSGTATLPESALPPQLFLLQSSRILTSSDPQSSDWWLGRLWDSQDGHAVSGELALVADAVLSPSGDRLITWPAEAPGAFRGHGDRDAWLWDPRTGRRVGQAIRVSDGVSFAAGGTRVLSTLTERGFQLQLLDSATGSPVGSPLRNVGGRRRPRVSPDGARFLTQPADGELRLCDGRTAEILGAAMHHPLSIADAGFTSDGRHVVSSDAGGSSYLWDGHTGQLIGVLSAPGGKRRGRSDISLAPNGRSVLRLDTYFEGDIATADRFMASLWRLAAPPPMTAGLGSASVLSPDHRRVLGFGYTGILDLWDADSGGHHVSTALPRGIYSRGMAISFDGSRVLLWTDEQGVAAWIVDGNSGKTIARTVGEISEIRSGAISANGNLAVLAGPSGALLWHAGSDRWTSVPDVAGYQAEINAPGTRIVLVNDEEARLFTGGLEGMTTLGEARGTEFSPDGDEVLTWHPDVIRVFSDSGSPRTPPMTHPAVQGARFNADGTKVLSWGWDGTARLWNSVTGQELGKPLPHGGEVHGAALSTDGRRVLTWGQDGNVRAWDVVTGVPLGAPMGPAEGGSWSEEGSLVSTYSQGVATLWDVGSGRRVWTSGEVNFLSRVEFTEDDRRLVALTGRLGTSGQLWELPGDRDFPPEHWTLAARALTGTTLNPESGEMIALAHESWLADKKRFWTLAREHYKTCKYPRQSLFRWFYKDEADRMRPEVRATELAQH